MMALAGYFFIAVIADIVASAMIGLVLTNLLVARFTKPDRPTKLPCASEYRALSVAKLPVVIIHL